MRNVEVLQKVKVERNVLQAIKRRKDNWIGQILRRNCRMKHAMEGKIVGRTGVKGRRGRKRKQLPDKLKAVFLSLCETAAR